MATKVGDRCADESNVGVGRGGAHDLLHIESRPVCKGAKRLLGVRLHLCRRSSTEDRFDEVSAAVSSASDAVAGVSSPQVTEVEVRGPPLSDTLLRQCQPHASSIRSPNDLWIVYRAEGDKQDRTHSRYLRMSLLLFHSVCVGERDRLVIEFFSFIFPTCHYNHRTCSTFSDVLSRKF